MRRRLTVTISTSMWLLGAVGVIAVGVVVGVLVSTRSTQSRSPTPPTVATTTTTLLGQRPGGGGGYGGGLIITFQPTASPTQRRAALAACGSLSGVIDWTLTTDGAGQMTIPFAGEVGVSDAQKAKDQSDRQHVFACLKASPVVANTTEGF